MKFEFGEKSKLFDLKVCDPSANTGPSILHVLGLVVTSCVSFVRSFDNNAPLDLHYI